MRAVGHASSQVSVEHAPLLDRVQMQGGMLNGWEYRQTGNLVSSTKKGSAPFRDGYGGLSAGLSGDYIGF